MRKWTLPVNHLLVRGERKWRSKGPLGLVGVLLGGAALVLAPAQSVQAQELFDGLPAPSMAQYESMWETITGLNYRAQSSSLVVGEEVQPGKFELVAFQTETAPGNGVATLVGTVTISESHAYQWLLPYVRIDELDDGTNDVEFSTKIEIGAAAVLIDAGNVYSWAVAVSVSTTVEILSGIGPDVVVGEKATFTVLTPLGFVSDAVEAGAIAERLAAMEDYDGPPIDPNDPVLTMQSFGVGVPDCATQCQNAYDTAKQKCKNTLRGALKNCGWAGIPGAAVGCLGGIAACPFFPPISNLICCVAGAGIGSSGAMGICAAMAQNDFAVCQANAWADYALCMLNNCGIVVVQD